MSADCPKECVQQKPDSPGPVGSSEVLIYIILDPDQWEDGQLSTAAFEHERLRKPDDGISVQRAAYSSPELVTRNVVGPQLAKKPPKKQERTFVGAIFARCADIRELRLDTQEKQRAICVIDDGTHDDPAHALLSYSESAKALTKGEEGRSQKLAIRRNLISKFRGVKNPLHLEAVFVEAAKLAG